MGWHFRDKRGKILTPRPEGGGSDMKESSAAHNTSIYRPRRLVEDEGRGGGGYLHVDGRTEDSILLVGKADSILMPL